MRECIVAYSPSKCDIAETSDSIVLKEGYSCAVNRHPGCKWGGMSSDGTIKSGVQYMQKMRKMHWINILKKWRKKSMCEKYDNWESESFNNVVNLNEMPDDQKIVFIQEVENMIEAVRTGKIEGEYFEF